MKKIVILVLMLSTAAALQAQKKLTVMFYNTENFFDTENDPTKNDEEYLPDSKLKWDEKKYQNKIDHISQVIDSVAGPGFPSLIGLCEVENEKVLKDLCSRSGMKSMDYGILITSGQDDRSIDVGLLYDKSQFELKGWQSVNVTSPEIPDYKTRDVLFATFSFNKKEVLHVFVNHWPSRRDGEEKSEPKRIYAAKIVRAKIDSLLKADPKARILIMGDFNDHPDNNSINSTLMAKSKPTAKNELLNLYYQIDKDKKGSHYFDKEWRSLDQIIVSQGFLKNKKGLCFDGKSAFVYKKDFILYKNEKTGEERPNRTYGGEKYFNGYSDHLPVYIQLTY
jgi:predicted extracellular nuclease